MPRVHHVKKARKDNPAVKKGESYYWWKFRFGGKRYSKERPPRWKLTQSAFLSTLWQLEDSIPNEVTREDIDNLTSELEGLRDECEYSLDNMPEQLRDTSESGYLLQERIDNLENWIAELESIDFDHMHPDEIAEAVMNANPGIG